MSTHKSDAAAASEMKPSGTAKALWPRTVTLADGRIATVSRATGREVILGSLAASADGSNPIVLLMGVAWSATKIDGQPVTWEEFAALDFMDIMALIGEVTGGKNALSPALAKS